MTDELVLSSTVSHADAYRQRGFGEAVIRQVSYYHAYIPKEA